MRAFIRLSTLAALPLLLTACQTYEATYVETPAVRRTYVVERGYDPYYAPRPIYRSQSYETYYEDYAPRRSYRERAYPERVYPGRSYGYQRPYAGPVTRPNYADRPSTPPVVVRDPQGQPAVVPDGRILAPGTRVIEQGGDPRASR